jgi:polyferredoxin
LIVQGSFAGIISGSAILFLSLFISSLFLGRGFCGWICPAGALQESCMQVNDKPVSPKQKVIKYIIWIPWLITIIMGFVTAGGIKSVDIIYLTDYGVTIANPFGIIIYFMVVTLILVLALVFGRRSFCHSTCWMAPFMIIGSKIKNNFNYPSLQLESDGGKCINCKMCDKNCPMSLMVSEMVKTNKMNSNECILCGKCESVCSKSAVHLGFKAIKK